MRILTLGGRQTLSFALCLCLFSISCIPTAAAAGQSDGSSNITTSPISVALNIKPGSSQTTTLQVKNNGSTALSMSVELKVFSAKGTNGQAAIHTPPAGDPTLSYVHFSKTTFTAQPGVYTPVQMTVTMPPEASLGYYYAVLFKPILPVKPNSNTNTINPSNAILVLVDTGSANENRALGITGFTANHKIYEYLPADFTINVHNNGNIFLAPSGVVYIGRSPDTTNLVGTLAINSSGGRILPNSSRDFKVTWRDGFPVFTQKTVAGQPVVDKKGRPINQLRWDFSKADRFRFGKYYARVALVYSNGQRQVPVYKTVSFWVIPWKLLAGVLMLIALQIGLVVLAVRYRRLYQKMRQGSNKREQP